MKKIRINAKSAPIMEQLLAKINAGFKNIEIQLIHEFISEKEYEDTKKAIKEYDIDISVVHTPLVDEPGKKAIEIALNQLLRDKYYEMFYNTCKYAQYIAEIENHKIKVVIHNNNSKEDWEESNLIQEKIGPRIKKILDECKNLNLVVENAPAYNGNRFNSVFDMEDVSYAVKKLNEVIDQNRVKTLLDTCHMMMNWEFWERTTNEFLWNWDDAFKKSNMHNSNLGLIHLNNLFDNGLHENHGTAFCKEIEKDLEELKLIMHSYNKYADCEITIEVREDSYIDTPVNLLTTKEALENLGYELDLG